MAPPQTSAAEPARPRVTGALEAAAASAALALVSCSLVSCSRDPRGGASLAAVEPPLTPRDAPLHPEPAPVSALPLDMEGPAALPEEPSLPEESAPPEGDELAALRGEVERLREELAREQERRVEREREWLAYVQALSALDLAAIPSDLGFEPEVPAEERAPPEPPRAESAEEETLRAVRQEEVLRSLRTLLAIEGVRGLDLLEAGALGPGWTGPVVFRTLDERGRLDGALRAERLRLEGSRAGRTLTLVLEEGFESHGGARDPFGALGAGPLERGARRIALRSIDPMPWVEALPELFGSAPLDLVVDDGEWNLEYVKLALNALLREDAAGGWYRLHSLGGVALGILRDVHMEGYDAQGRLERRIFADRLELAHQERGVVLRFEDGAIVRGEEQRPFVDGRYRVVLPRARSGAWDEARLPIAPRAGALTPPEGGSRPVH